VAVESGELVFLVGQVGGRILHVRRQCVDALSQDVERGRGLCETLVQLLLRHACAQPVQRLDLRTERRQHRPQLLRRGLLLHRNGLHGLELGGLPVQPHLDAHETGAELVELASEVGIGRRRRNRPRRQRLQLLADQCELPLALREPGGGRRDGRRDGLESLAEKPDLVGELVDLPRACLLRALVGEGRHRLAELEQLTRVRSTRCLRPSRERLNLLVASLEVSAEGRDLAVLLGHRRRGGRDGGGESVEALGDQVDPGGEALLDLRLVLRREHGPGRVRSTQAARDRQNQRACS
jgi:hypothetical protein